MSPVVQRNIPVWVVHVVFTRTDEAIPCTSLEDAQELVSRIRQGIEQGVPVRVEGHLGSGISDVILNPGQMVKVWIEETVGRRQ